MILYPELQHFTLADVYASTFDLVMLRHLAAHVQEALRWPLAPGALPFLAQTRDEYGYAHRIVLYQNRDTFERGPLFFVGFLGKKRLDPEAAVVEALTEVDKTLIMELAKAPDILSYSSVELHDGNWCNLVVFRKQEAKETVTQHQMHMLAAHQLAPQYYEWIRLHRGILLEGFTPGQLVIVSTKFYLFGDEGREAAMRSGSLTRTYTYMNAQARIYEYSYPRPEHVVVEL
uniref:Uncharacterized protein n=1 Tax=Thermosporothrix sp. COM3 TaxID=2490863 RepID=A0A455SCI1_9CHLR|nr:hypothetical protein KTC_02170 [Thermosporothrix sp. COM3]